MFSTMKLLVYEQAGSTLSIHRSLLFKFLSIGVIIVESGAKALDNEIVTLFMGGVQYVCVFSHSC